MDDEWDEPEIADEQPDADTRVARATTLLGEPDQVYRSSPGRVRAKLALGTLLLIVGVALNVGWFGFGPGNFSHVHFLIMPPIIGGGLLWHLWRHRGQRVLLYPAGLLRLQRGEIDSFPWDELTSIRMRIQPQGEPQIHRDDTGAITSVWLNTTAPTFQVWNVWLDLTRNDGVSTRCTAVLADFPELVAEVQRRTFPQLWATTRAALTSELTIEFAEGFTATNEGITQGKVSIRWEEMKYLNLAGKLLSIKRKGAWLAGIARDATTIANIHILFALAAEHGVLEQLEAGDDD